MRNYFDVELERHITLGIDDESTEARLEAVGKALSSRERIRILRILKRKSMSIVEIAEALSLAVSSASFHVNYLEQAGLIITETQPGRRGSMKVCSGGVETLTLDINGAVQLASDYYTIDMPIGHYSDCDIRSTCGLAGSQDYIGDCDDPRTFYLPERVHAQLIWFQQGYVEYRFPNRAQAGKPIKSLSFSLELCSEAPGYRNVWPSDITFSVNGCEITTFTSPGDYGGRHGILTPAWWSDGNTQYGLLKTLSIRGSGCTLDESPCHADITVQSLDLGRAPYIALRVAIKPDAEHVGGINLFGEQFGDHAQSIVMRVDF